MSRTPDAIHGEMLDLCPTGWALTAARESWFGLRFRATANEFAAIEAAMDALLVEADPRAAANLLTDYERVLGPDPCGRDALGLSVADRQALTFQRWTQGGNICAGAFVAMGVAIGVTLTITEYRPWECGVSAVDDELIPSPEHCSFLVSLPSTRDWVWECGASAVDDPLGGSTPNLMECVIRALAPLHTRADFLYTS